MHHIKSVAVMMAVSMLTIALVERVSFLRNTLYTGT